MDIAAPGEKSESLIEKVRHELGAPARLNSERRTEEALERRRQSYKWGAAVTAAVVVGRLGVTLPFPDNWLTVGCISPIAAGLVLVASGAVVIDMSGP